MLCYGRRVVERWSTFFFEFDHQVHFEQGTATNESDRGGYLRSLIGWRMSQKILNMPSE